MYRSGTNLLDVLACAFPKNTGQERQVQLEADMAAETKGQEAQDVEMSESGKGTQPGIGQVLQSSCPFLSETVCLSSP